MATGKKPPHSPKGAPKGAPKGPISPSKVEPRKPAARSAAKPPVINLKATEVKAAKDTKADTAASPKGQPKPTTSKATPSKITPTKSAPSKPAPSKSSETKKPTSTPKQPAKKKRGKTGLMLVSLAALVAAGLGGAWAFKEYGQKFFTSPNSANTAQIATLTKQLTASDEKLASLQASLNNTAKQISASTAAQAKTNAKLASLETSLAQINTALKQAAKKGAGPADAANTLALEKLTSDLKNISATVKGLKSAASTNNASSDQATKAITALKAQLETVSQSLATSQASNKTAADKLVQTTKTLTALKLAQTKLQNAPTSSPSGKMASAFTVLRANISSGKPFTAELDQIATQLPQELSLDKLRPFAEKGAPTKDSLLAALTGLSFAPTTTGETPAPATQDGIWNSMTSKLSGLVKVSKVGETDWQGQQNQAIKLLKSGDLKAAVGQLKSASQQPPKALLNWLEIANKKLDIDAAIAQLSASVMARLTATSQASGQSGSQ